MKDAFAKFLFCKRISADSITFIKLLWHTKQFALNKKNYSYTLSAAENPVAYQFKISNSIHNIFLRTAAGDIAVFYEIYWLGVYQLPGFHFRDCKIIVDIGANIGLATLFLSIKSPHALLFCIEPDAANFSLLQLNLKKQVTAKKVTAIHAAVSNEDGTVNIKRSGLAYNTSVVNDALAGEIKALSVNTLMAAHHIKQIDLLKIDVEGFEHQIFSTNLQWLNKVSNIIIEIHTAKDYEVCSFALKRYGFQLQRLKPVSTGIEHIYWAKR